MAMAQGSCRFRVTNGSDAPSVLIIEPWASEYPLLRGKTYDVVVEGDLAHSFEIEWRPDAVIVYALDGAGSLVTVYEDGHELP